MGIIIIKYNKKEINKIFIEIIVAPSFTDKAVEILKGKKNIRILKLENISAAAIPAKTAITCVVINLSGLI